MTWDIYRLEVPVDSIGRGWITGKVAGDTVAEILELIQFATLGQTQQLNTGFVLSKVREDSSRLVPWLVAPELPYDLALTDRRARALRKEFRRIVQEGELKFTGYTGARILLIGLSQSGLDCEFHAGRFKGGQGVMLTWAQNVGRNLGNVDYIYLEPGINVWQPTLSSSDNLTLHKVFASHRYTNSTAGNYVLLRQRPGTPRLLR